jgi:hypothetical protein
MEPAAKGDGVCETPHQVQQPAWGYAMVRRKQRFHPEGVPRPVLNPRSFEVSHMHLKSALHRRLASLAVASLAALAGTAAIEQADARSSRDARRGDPGLSRAAGTPRLAVVGLSEQRVTIYDGEGRMLQSPVSSGANGYETPAGVYSVVQKKEDHHSNVYLDGHMPFMQRITWTGIALHAGVLPGQPASHGCVRLPHAFAERLFGLTDIGLRVVIVPSDIAPATISHPLLFQSRQAPREASAARLDVASGGADLPARAASARLVESLKAQAAAKAAEADAAAKRAAEARRVAARKAAEAAPSARAIQGAESGAARAEAVLKAAEQALATASSPEAVEKAEAAKAKAAEKLSEAQGRLEAVQAQAQARKEAAERAAEEAKAAEAARDLALEVAGEAALRSSPVSVFVSRKTQRLYIRKDYQPVFEGPVTIRDAEKPIGTYVFTAMNTLEDGAKLRWNVVSMYRGTGDGGAPAAEATRRKGEARQAAAAPADVAGAGAALDRIVIPPDALERINDVVLPGSSLIVSDEGASIETGKDTDFVIVMSGEPQGGLKKRQREVPRYGNDEFFGGGGGSYFPFFKF